MANSIWAKRYGPQEVSALIAVFALVGAFATWEFFKQGQTLAGAIFVFSWSLIIAGWIAWAKATGINRTEDEFKKEIPAWKDDRKAAFYYLQTVQSAGVQAVKTPTEYLRQSMAVTLMLDRIENVCLHDADGLLGSIFVESHFWPLLKLYWHYAHPLIIAEQKINPKKWCHIFPPYKKYEKLLNDYQTDIQVSLVGFGPMLQREAHAVTE